MYFALVKISLFLQRIGLLGVSYWTAKLCRKLEKRGGVKRGKSKRTYFAR